MEKTDRTCKVNESQENKMFTRDHYNEDYKKEKEFWICIQNLNEEIPSMRGWDKKAAEKSLTTDVYHFDPSESESDSPCSITFHPDFAFGTAAIWAIRTLTCNCVAYWEVQVEKSFGTSMMFGIGTRKANVQTRLCFVDLLGGFSGLPRSGLDRESFGLNHLGMAIHGGVRRQFCEEFSEDQKSVIGMLFNGPEGTLEYALNGRWLGLAFQNIFNSCICTAKSNNQSSSLRAKNDGATFLAENICSCHFYPMVASTSQQSCFRLIQQKIAYVVPSLQKLCEQRLLKSLKAKTVQSQQPISKLIDKLPLPPIMLRKIYEKLIDWSEHHPGKSKSRYKRHATLMYYNGKTEAGGDVALQTDRSSTDEATACDLMDEGHNIFKRRKL